MHHTERRWHHPHASVGIKITRAARHKQFPHLHQHKLARPSTFGPHSLEHHVLADKKTFATHTYSLRHAHHHPHAQFVKVCVCVRARPSSLILSPAIFFYPFLPWTQCSTRAVCGTQNWSRQLRNDKALTVDTGADDRKVMPMF